MAAKYLTVEVRVAWWFKFYLAGVCWFSSLTGSGLDSEKVNYWAGKAVKVVRK